MPHSADKPLRASTIGVWSLLNLTLLPGFSFVILLKRYMQAKRLNLSQPLHAARISIVLNVLAFVLLFGVSAAVWFGPWFDTAGKLAVLITYFTLVHSLFILVALWWWAKWHKEELH
ncbi:MAG: hypothetical protein D6694_05810 [Gammaproteobacteria bacterium]|nr:MAG: hypothetical protein D6694_05810 [Gammaproteobacteria bacterium]